MIRAILLDSSPLSLLAKAARTPDVVAINQWLKSMLNAGVKVYVPEIIDYEVRRELVRANKSESVARLNALKLTAAYLPLTTDVMLLAADLWAQSRQQRMPTADPKELDCDVILAAQALSLSLPPAEFVIATSNVGHLTRFVPANLWSNIKQ